MSEGKKNIAALGDEALEAVSGGRNIVVGQFVGYCENCGAKLTTDSLYLCKTIGGKTYYYCESHKTPGAKAPGKNC